MPVVTLLNQKGGVGKTSTCHHLAGTLADAGRRVLLVDNDPQASLSQGLLGPAALRGLDPSATIAAVYRLRSPDAEEVIRRTEILGIDLLPGSKHANDFNLPRPHEADWDLQEALGEFLADVRSRYDLVLIDCPPNLCLCSWAALLCSDALVVPMQPEDYGAQGMVEVQESIDRVRTHNPRLKLLGYLLTMVSPRLGVHKLYEATLREMYGDDVFRTTVPVAADFKEAIGRRLPVSRYKPRSAAARVFKELAAEVDDRLGRLPAAREVA